MFSKEIFQEAYVNMLRIIIYHRQTYEGSRNFEKNIEKSYEVYDNYILISQSYNSIDDIYIYYLQFLDTIDKDLYPNIELWITEVHSDLIEEITHYYKNKKDINLYRFIRSTYDNYLWMKPIQNSTFINMYKMRSFEEDSSFLPLYTIKKYIKNKSIFLHDYSSYSNIHVDSEYINQYPIYTYISLSPYKYTTKQPFIFNMNHTSICKEYDFIYMDKISYIPWENNFNNISYQSNKNDTWFITLYSQIIVKQLNGDFLKYKNKDIYIKTPYYFLYIIYLPDKNKNVISYMIIIQSKTTVLSENIYKYVYEIDKILIQDCENFIKKNDQYWIVKPKGKNTYIHLFKDCLLRDNQNTYMEQINKNTIISNISIKTSDITHWTPPTVYKIYNQTKKVDDLFLNKDLLWKYDTNKIIVPPYYKK